MTITMPGKRDYYEVLGIDHSASESEVAEAYRKLALQYHPDRNPGDESAVARFKEAAEAFEVLSHSEKRRRYDRYGHAGLEAGGGAPQFRDISEIFSAFGDIFGEGLFGDVFGSRRGRRFRRGGDVQCEVSIELAEVARGTTKTIRFQRHEFCGHCRGSGARPGTKPEGCRYCGGQGRVLQSGGFFAVQATCPSCRGAGVVIRDPCPQCNGGGAVRETLTRELSIPPGVDENSTLRIEGAGDPSPDGGPRGNCYCHIHVNPHPLFERHGRDLVVHVPISYSQAALGARIEVPSLETCQELTIPPGTSSGEVFKVRGLGLPSLRSRERGDLLVQVHIEVPKRLSEQHEEVLRRLAEIERTQVTPKRKSFFDKLKEYLIPETGQAAKEDRA